MSDPTARLTFREPTEADAGAGTPLAAEDGSLAAQILAEDRFSRLLQAAARDASALAHLLAVLEEYRLPPEQRDAILRVVAEAASLGAPHQETEPPLP